MSIQRQLPANIVVDMAYVGSHALKQFENFNLNELPEQYFPSGNTLNQTVTNPFRGVLPATSNLGQGATVTRSRLLVRHPQYNNVNLQGANSGRGLYHSGQLNVNKRVSHGLSATFIYTFSRLMDNNTTSVINPRRYRSVSQFDQKHVSRLALTYDLPWQFKGASAGLSRGANGLGRMAAFEPAYAGLGHTAIGDASQQAAAARGESRLDGLIDQRLGDRRSGNRVANPFNIDAFRAFATPFVVTPELPWLDELRSPGTRSLNLNLFKAIPIRERLKLELRMEASGVTNTRNFGAPGTALNNAATFGVINSAGGARSMQGRCGWCFDAGGDGTRTAFARND